MSSSDSGPPPDKTRKTRRSKDSRESKRLSELVKLLLSEERESNEVFTEQLKLEKRRADDAEAKVNQALAHMKTLNAARLAALRDATQANKELSLYKAQLATAQNEVNRAQSVLSVLEAQKREAESDAARARTMARQLRQEKLIADAREEGRRLGLQEGLEKGRQMGYQRGRATGYAHGRSSVEKARDNTVKDDGYRSPSPDVYRFPRNPVAHTRKSPVQALAPESTSITPVVHPPPSTIPPGQPDRVVPIPTRHVAPSPRHSAVNIPPDNWIPHLDEDNRIRLPPPHELTPELSPLLENPLPQLPIVSEEAPVLMVPAPALVREESPPLVLRSNSPLQRRTRRRNSSESGSTTISQLDILNEPSHLVQQANPSSPLSVIQEVVSAQTSPRTTASQATSRKGSSPQLREILTAAHNPVIPNLEVLTNTSIVSPDTSNDTRLHPHNYNRRRSESSLSTDIGITVEPPSRPLSDSSIAADTQPYGGFLSPADANRPVPLPEPTRDTQAVIPNVLSMTTSLTSSSSGPIILPDDQLPLGFVPSGPFTPSHSSVPLSPLSGTTSAMSSGNGFFAGGVMEHANGPPVGMMNGNGRVSRGSRRRAPDSDDSSSSSTGSSTDTMATPPGRTRGVSNVSPHPDIVIPVPAPEPVEAAARPTASKTKAGRRGRGRR